MDRTRQVCNSRSKQSKAGIETNSKILHRRRAIKTVNSIFLWKIVLWCKGMAINNPEQSGQKMIWQASSRMLQIVKKDYNRVHSFESLHKQFKRASPAMWCNYVTACAMHDVVINRVPENVIAKMTINWLSNSRRRGMTFTRSNKLKIGFNCLSNRLQNVSTNLDVDWQQMSNTSFKLRCKRQFLNWAQ